MIKGFLKRTHIHPRVESSMMTILLPLLLVGVLSDDKQYTCDWAKSPPSCEECTPSSPTQACGVPLVLPPQQAVLGCDQMRCCAARNAAAPDMPNPESEVRMVPVLRARARPGA